MKDPTYGGLFLCTVCLSMCLYFIASLTDPGYVDTAQYKQVGQVQNLVMPSASNLWGRGLVILKLSLHLVLQPIYTAANHVLLICQDLWSLYSAISNSWFCINFTELNSLDLCCDSYYISFTMLP